MPVARQAAAKAGRVNRDVVADGLREQGYSISNERMGKLLLMIDDAKPPPKPATDTAHSPHLAAQRPTPTPNSFPRKRS
ncbi:hypothetical protein ACIOGZ_03030 [Kitasatospora sp. NPDC088160]|uniref:hypothetical protein n=1 Tax=Kitasatospora sp. NPDC088160 TaxID=3364072 RepID=UPI00381D5046